MRLGARGLRRVGGTSHAPASSIFLMISQLYTLLAHLRSLGRDGTSCSTSSYLTAVAGQRGGVCQGTDAHTRRLFFWESGGGRRRVIAPPGRGDRAIEQKRRRASVDREWICRLARRRRIDRATASMAAPPKPATLWRRKVGPVNQPGERGEKKLFRPDTYRQPPGSTSPPAGGRSSGR